MNKALDRSLPNIRSSGSIQSRGSSGSIMSIGSTGSILSIGSAGSILSIGSSGSILSIGSSGSLLSVGSFLSVASLLSFGSVGSILSALSSRSVLSWRSVNAVRASAVQNPRRGQRPASGAAAEPAAGELPAGFEAGPVPGVPVVDISADPAAVGAELDEICRSTGFFQVTGHGLEDGVTEPAWTLATAFFDLPLEDKLSVARPAADYPYGYIPLAGEALSQSMAGASPPDLKEVFNMGPPARPGRAFADPGEAWSYSANLWPGALPEMRPAWTAYYDAMRALGNRLMSLLARGLGLPPGFFAGQTGHGPNALRAINYPAREHAPRPGQLRAGPHTDYGTLTILRQDAAGGLEVLDPAGAWVSVPPVPGAFVVNLGDLMARWTNDRWRSTLHRVVDPPGPDIASTGQARRQSMPYFQNANWSARISCLPTCLAPGERPRYEPVLAGPHLMGKFRRSVTP